MTEVCLLGDKNCVPCEGGVPALTETEAKALMKQLDDGWELSGDAKFLKRRLEFKGFAKATYTANLAAFLGDQQGHHPDIAFGWGYCSVTFTTHAIDGLSENDFICAAKFDAMLAK
ncbi:MULTISPECIES: 4a-hydroxytetrahydrobiopterin dehydratase [Halocynthiibacter]|uniref:4a-hydroxytetrahydrobiopterin dehydratase n=1 Tax=Halocynthiibacter halioticoli TaxID=2986804 RepID=A0AAE3J0U1_9RHOB|nr:MULTISPECIES: 4a-hydroxytetrahydrobiopterin dehydratase [Halocynthiibacter]MCV6824630.1 4a-hydroxytetrahydrobiopterin dehydratase [Halocynthiibacter halioticoli]MCW4057631.1 4a-hydroxytetrahydrobiopterin dehydratase [Halocynthiibacter sp. SDUM655004]